MSFVLTSWLIQRWLVFCIGLMFVTVPPRSAMETTPRKPSFDHAKQNKSIAQSLSSCELRRGQATFFCEVVKRETKEEAQQHTVEQQLAVALDQTVVQEGLAALDQTVELSRQ